MALKMPAVLRQLGPRASATSRVENHVARQAASTRIGCEAGPRRPVKSRKKSAEFGPFPASKSASEMDRMWPFSETPQHRKSLKSEKRFQRLRSPMKSMGFCVCGQKKGGRRRKAEKALSQNWVLAKTTAYRVLGSWVLSAFDLDETQRNR